MIARRREANIFRKLASQLKIDLNMTTELARQTQEFAEKLFSMPLNSKNPYLYAVALSLQHFYTSLETMLKRVIKDIDGRLPEGESWHKELLETSVLKIEGVRPALFSRKLLEKVDRIRRFRHIVRHGYEYDLDYTQMEPVVDSLEFIIPQLEEDIDDFIIFLNETADLIEE